MEEGTTSRNQMCAMWEEKREEKKGGEAGTMRSNGGKNNLFRPKRGRGGL